MRFQIDSEHAHHGRKGELTLIAGRGSVTSIVRLSEKDAKQLVRDLQKELKFMATLEAAPSGEEREKLCRKYFGLDKKKKKGRK